MHMPQQSGPAPIVSGPPGAITAALWRSLRPEHWPLSPEDLPAGTALVGGAVRDALLGRLQERPDLDLVVPEEALALTRGLARRLGGSFVALDPGRSIARLVLQGWTIDLARQAGSDLAADLERRDYTINAMALPLPASAAQPPLALVDPHGGLAHLAARRLVAIREANLLDDPLRLLRGVRLAAELDFTIEPATWGWIAQHHGRLAAVAGERVLAELERLVAAAAGAGPLAEALEAGLLRPWGGVAAAEASPLLAILTPAEAAARGLSAAEEAVALPLARLAAVLSGEGLARLQASRRLQQRCRLLRRWRRELAERGAPDLDALPEALRLELQRTLEADLPALLLHLPPAAAQAALARWRDPADPLFHPRPPLDGRQLQQELGLAAGPELGRLLEHLSRERAFGRLPSAGHDQPLRPEQRLQVLRAARQWATGSGASA
ncbi:MAG: CCA tRNA nucleotidyltransferase [Synechococcaceae cyanobacterium]|nr:CCA tRNA nucleotidyltransferase [Synechococcaceae cyanobacterium]